MSTAQVVERVQVRNYTKQDRHGLCSVTGVMLASFTE